MELQTNASKVVELDRKIKALTEQFTAVKLELMSQMIADNVSEVVIKRKKVILCHRQNKDFGSEINRQELELKAEKKKFIACHVRHELEKKDKKAPKEKGGRGGRAGTGARPPRSGGFA